jgi:putative cell wall-binding protein
MVLDDCRGTFTDPVEVIGNGDTVLEPGELWEYTCNTTFVFHGMVGAIVTGRDSGGGEISASAHLDYGAPVPFNVQVVPSAASVVAGSDVVWTTTIGNDGPYSIMNVRCEIRIMYGQPGPIPYWPLTLFEVDGNGDALLDPGERWRCIHTSTVYEESYADVTYSGAAVHAPGSGFGRSARSAIVTIRPPTALPSIILGGKAVVTDDVAYEVEWLLDGPHHRVAGADRYQTATQVSNEFFASAPVVYVATGETFPDSLAGGPLAARHNAPILLVGHNWVPPSVYAEIQRLAPSRIVILGGPGAVNAVVEGQLAARTGKPIARVQGVDRYATAARISDDWSPGVPAVYLATGADYPDALAGGAAAASADVPILLVERDRVPGATAAALDRLDPAKIVLLGGNGAISAGVEAAVAAYATGGHVERWAGYDRYATAAAICSHAFPNEPPIVFIATGENFPDALAGVVAAGLRDAPILLVHKDWVPAATADELWRLTGR